MSYAHSRPETGGYDRRPPSRPDSRMSYAHPRPDKGRYADDVSVSGTDRGYDRRPPSRPDSRMSYAHPRPENGRYPESYEDDYDRPRSLRDRGNNYSSLRYSPTLSQRSMRYDDPEDYYSTPSRRDDYVRDHDMRTSHSPHYASTPNQRAARYAEYDDYDRGSSVSRRVSTPNQGPGRYQAYDDYDRESSVSRRVSTPHQRPSRYEEYDDYGRASSRPRRYPDEDDRMSSISRRDDRYSETQGYEDERYYASRQPRSQRYDEYDDHRSREDERLPYASDQYRRRHDEHSSGGTIRRRASTPYRSPAERRRSFTPGSTYGDLEPGHQRPPSRGERTPVYGSRAASPAIGLGISGINTPLTTPAELKPSSRPPSALRGRRTPTRAVSPGHGLRGTPGSTLTELQQAHRSPSLRRRSIQSPGLRPRSRRNSVSSGFTALRPSASDSDDGPVKFIGPDSSGESSGWNPASSGDDSDTRSMRSLSRFSVIKISDDESGDYGRDAHSQKSGRRSSLRWTEHAQVAEFDPEGYVADESSGYEDGEFTGGRRGHVQQAADRLSGYGKQEEARSGGRPGSYNERSRERERYPDERGGREYDGGRGGRVPIDPRGGRHQSDAKGGRAHHEDRGGGYRSHSRSRSRERTYDDRRRSQSYGDGSGSDSFEGGYAI